MRPPVVDSVLNVAPWVGFLVFIRCVAPGSEAFSCWVFSSWTLFARTEDLHVGALIGPEPPGLPPCEKLAAHTPTGGRHPGPAPVPLGSPGPGGWPAPAALPQCNRYERRPKQHGRQGSHPRDWGQTGPEPAHKGRRWPAGGQERGWRRCQPPHGPGPVIRAHGLLWPQLNKPAVINFPPGFLHSSISPSPEKEGLPLRRGWGLAPWSRPREGGAAEG